ncbi:MAG: hypothetical protein U9R00_00595 [Patescibacteria group bacterium]|nr:hypothetical protein [Patescibacteria group bacterium]
MHLIPVAEASISSLMNSIDRVIINPLIILIFALAMVLFMYGIAKYLFSPGSEEKRNESKRNITWGLLGMFIMISVFLIMRLILNSLGEKNIDINNKGEIKIQEINLE